MTTPTCRLVGQDGTFQSYGAETAWCLDNDPMQGILSFPPPVPERAAPVTAGPELALSAQHLNTHHVSGQHHVCRHNGFQ